MSEANDVYVRNKTTPEELVEIVDHIASQLAEGFIFGPFEENDITQQIYILSLEALHRTKGKCYDPSRPLDDFLYTNAVNRLKNFKRDKFYRGHSPCKECPLYDPDFAGSDNQCLGFAQRFDCDKYRAYRKRNDAKASLCGVADQTDRTEPVGGENPILEELCRNDLLDLIDKMLPADIRPDFLKLVANVKISHKRRDIVRAAIREIILNSGQFPELDDYFEEDTDAGI